MYFNAGKGRNLIHLRRQARREGMFQIRETMEPM
jgi:hypothetical protein